MKNIVRKLAVAIAAAAFLTAVPLSSTQVFAESIVKSSDSGVQKLSSVTSSDGKTTIVDVVKYENLLPAHTYKVSGKLMDKETGKAILSEGKEITAEKNFTTENAVSGQQYVNGSVELSYTLDAAVVEGKTVVVFEDLYDSSVKVASHADITDEDQTVYYPSISTSASFDDDTTVTAASGTKVIIDTVMYKNLTAGKEYVLKGTLMDQSTGARFKDGDGKEVTASATFTPSSSNGSTTVKFSFKAEGLNSTSIVVFEDLYMDNIRVAAHADINDENQTVKIGKEPSIGIIKTDGMNSSVTVEGAKYELFSYSDKKNTSKGVVTTDSNGYAQWTNLSSGIYILKEMEAPEGHDKHEDIVFKLKNETKDGSLEYSAAYMFSKQSEQDAEKVESGDESGLKTWSPYETRKDPETGETCLVFKIEEPVHITIPTGISSSAQNVQMILFAAAAALLILMYKKAETICEN